jgi:hypothetical protein
MSVATLDNLSALQKKLLSDALRAHYYKPFSKEKTLDVSGFGPLGGSLYLTTLP